MTNDNTPDPEKKKILDAEMEKKLAALEEKIEFIQKGNDEEHKKNYGDPAKSNSAEKLNKRAASEFFGSVLGGAIIGFTIDYFFDSAPFGFFFFIILGFASGVMRANNLVNKNND